MNQPNCHPIIKYPGAKWRIAPWIIGNMPQHKSYLEPYFGSGAVFFQKEPSRIETINDLDEDVVNLFRVVRECAVELSQAVAMTPFARQEYYSAFEPTDEPIEKARRFLLKTWQGHGFRTCCQSGWKIDVAGREYGYAVRYWNELPGWIMNIVDRLKGAQIEHMPAVDLIRRFNRPDVLVYCDPPYILSTRGLKKQYVHEMTDADHLELLETLQQHQGPVMISGYDNDLYNQILQEWTKLQRETTAEKGKRRTETLWMNFEYQLRL